MMHFIKHIDILIESLMTQYGAANLIQFVKRHIRHWTRNAMIVNVTWGYGGSIMCEVREFEPNGDFLSLQSQYQWSMMTNKYETVRAPSLPIGMISFFSQRFSKARKFFRHGAHGTHGLAKKVSVLS